MKAALIPPIPCLKQFGVTGKFHLLLSHLLKDPVYFSHYLTERERGAYLLLDNSAHEHGHGDDPEALIYNAVALKAQEVVVPDVLEDAEGTVESALNALEYWFEKKDKVIRKLNPALMYVPQARHMEEWVWCFGNLVRMHQYVTGREGYRTSLVIGVSKDYEVWHEQGLMPILDFLSLMRQNVKFQVHLLGWGRDLWNLEMYAKEHPWIRSTDSAKPFVYGLERIKLEPHEDVPEYPKRPHNYFTRRMDDEQLQVSILNAMIFRAMASGSLSTTVQV